MKNFLVTEQERINILKKHRSLLNEGPQDDYKKLQAGYNAGCFGNPPPALNNTTKFLPTPQGSYIFRKPSVRQPGKFVHYTTNNEYYFFDPKNGQYSNLFKNQPCPAMENYGVPTTQEKNTQYEVQYWRGQNYKTLQELQAANENVTGIDNNPSWDRKQFGDVVLYRRKDNKAGGLNTKDDPNDALRKAALASIKAAGYEIEPTVEQKRLLRPYKLYELGIQGVEPGMFPADQVVYYDKAANRNRVDLAIQQQQTDVSKEVCRQRIEAFYQEFLNNRGEDYIPDQGGLRIRKNEVRFCVNRWEGKWGLFGGKIKDMVETLKGNTAESPSSSGVDAIFRL
jgi:hypothetical protein